MSKSKKSKKTRINTQTSKFNIKSYFQFPNDQNTKFYFIIAFIVLIVSIVIRSYNLGALWLNEDEAYTMTAAKRIITGTGTPNDASPIFIGIQYLFYIILGINETAGRIPSVLFAIATIIFFFYFIKKYINIETAIFFISIIGLSFFNVYMSRLGRPYTALQFYYIVLIFIFYKILNNIKENQSLNDSVKKIIFNKNSFLFILIFIISLYTHPWTVLIITSLLCYFFLNLIFFLFKKDYNNEFKLNLLFFSILFFLIFSAILVVNLNLFPNLFKGMQTDAFGIDIKRSIEFLSDNPIKGLLHYLKLIYYDFKNLWIIALLGFIFSFSIIKDRKILFLIHSVVLSHLIMLGFFINVLQQRYFFPAYSFYFIYVALGFYIIYTVIVNFLNLQKNFVIRNTLIIILILIIIPFIPFEKYKNMYSIKMIDNIYLDKKIGEYTFYPYRYACEYVKNNIKEGEDVICLMPRIAEFYIDRNIYNLRQVKFNRNKLNSSDQLIADTTLYPNSMQNHRSFLNFLKEHKSGWIIADARLNTTLSPETKNFILTHFDFHFLGSNPPSVMLVGHWDSTTLYKKPQYFWVLHEFGKEAFLPYQIQVDPNMTIKLTVVYSGVEKENEALTIIGKLSSYLPPNRNLGVPDTADWVMKADELVKSKGIGFIYNSSCGDSLKGFMIHNIITLLGK